MQKSREPGQEVRCGWCSAPPGLLRNQTEASHGLPNNSRDSGNTRKCKRPPNHPLLRVRNKCLLGVYSAIAITGTKNRHKKSRGKKIKSGSKNSILFHPLPPTLSPQPPVHFSPLVPTATLQSEKNKFRGAGFGGVRVKTVKSQ